MKKMKKRKRTSKQNHRVCNLQGRHIKDSSHVYGLREQPDAHLARLQGCNALVGWWRFILLAGLNLHSAPAVAAF